ncbi:hypothetical protein ACSSS7_001246 [Eimeria intestinalis]
MPEPLSPPPSPPDLYQLYLQEKARGPPIKDKYQSPDPVHMQLLRQIAFSFLGKTASAAPAAAPAVAAVAVIPHEQQQQQQVSSSSSSSSCCWCCCCCCSCRCCCSGGDLHTLEAAAVAGAASMRGALGDASCIISSIISSTYSSSSSISIRSSSISSTISTRNTTSSSISSSSSSMSICYNINISSSSSSGSSSRSTTTNIQGPLVTSVSSASSRPPDTHSNRGPRNEFEHSLKPNKEIILLFGVSGCSAKGSARTRTVYVLQQEVPPHHPYPLREEKEGIVANPSPFRTHEGVIPDFSSNQKSGASTPPPINRRGPPENPSSHGEEGWEGPPPCSQEEADSPCSLDKEEKGGPTPPDQEVGHPSRPPSQGGPPTQTSQGLSEGPPASPLCEIDSVTLHHMDCAMIHLKKCASFINPDILVELALSSECVKVVDFDYKAFPINSDPEEEESEKEGETGQTSSSSDSLAHARRRGPPSSETEGRRGRTKHLALPPFLPNDPLLLSGAQWELLDAAGVQARKAWMASKGQKTHNTGSRSNTAAATVSNNTSSSSGSNSSKGSSSSNRSDMEAISAAAATATAAAAAAIKEAKIAKAAAQAEGGTPVAAAAASSASASATRIQDYNKANWALRDVSS